MEVSCVIFTANGELVAKDVAILMNTTDGHFSAGQFNVPSGRDIRLTGRYLLKAGEKQWPIFVDGLDFNCEHPVAKFIVEVIPALKN